MLQNPVMLGFEPCPAGQQVPWGSRVCHMARAAGEGWPGLRAGPRAPPGSWPCSFGALPLVSQHGERLETTFQIILLLGVVFFYFGLVWVFLNLCHLPTNPKEFGSI